MVFWERRLEFLKERRRAHLGYFGVALRKRSIVKLDIRLA